MQALRDFETATIIRDRIQRDSILDFAELVGSTFQSEDPDAPLIFGEPVEGVPVGVPDTREPTTRAALPIASLGLSRRRTAGSSTSARNTPNISSRQR